MISDISFKIFIGVTLLSSESSFNFFFSSRACFFSSRCCLFVYRACFFSSRSFFDVFAFDSLTILLALLTSYILSYLSAFTALRISLRSRLFFSSSCIDSFTIPVPGTFPLLLSPNAGSPLLMTSISVCCFGSNMLTFIFPLEGFKVSFIDVRVAWLNDDG